MVNKKFLILPLVCMIFLIGISSATLVDGDNESAVSHSATGDSAGLTITLYSNATYGYLKAVGAQNGADTGVFKFDINQSGTTLATGTATIDTTYRFTNFTYGGNYSAPIEEGEFTLDIHLISGSGGISRGNPTSYSGTLFSWTAQVCPHDYAGPTFTYTELVQDFQIDLISPIDENKTLNSTVQFTTHHNVSGTNLVNTTLIVWHSNGTIFDTNYTTITGTTNSTYLSISNLAVADDYIWNSLTCSDAVLCNYSSSNRTFSVVEYLENYQVYESVNYETAEETYVINISTDGGETTSAELFYGNVGQGTATKTGTDANANFSQTVQIPLGTGNNSIIWQITVGSNSYNTTEVNQTIGIMQFGLCNATLTQSYLNISFQDEADSTVINATIPTSSFVYYLGDGTYTKTYELINNTANYYYAFCAIPMNKTFHIDPYIQYASTDYPQRIWNPTLTDYTNSTTNQTLYLLGEADGIYVTFQVINIAEETLSGVSVNVTRVIGGETIVVGDGTTDASGSVTFWLNPDFQHTIMFSLTGYTTTSYSVTPTQTSYTITLGSTTTTTSDYSRGINISINPNSDFLDNNTVYNFNFTISSTYWTLIEFGINLTYENGTVIGSTTSTTGTGGILEINTINVTFFSSNESRITMDYYYIINSTSISNSRTWVMQSITGRSFSIWNFFTDLSLYTNSDNFFGFDDFGRILLSVLILVMVAGGISLRYGVRSDLFVVGVIFGIVLILDFGLGFIPPIRIGDNFAINNFLTFVVAIILIATIIQEERK